MNQIRYYICNLCFLVLFETRVIDLMRVSYLESFQITVKSKINLVVQNCCVHLSGRNGSATKTTTMNAEQISLLATITTRFAEQKQAATEASEAMNKSKLVTFNDALTDDERATLEAAREILVALASRSHQNHAVECFNEIISK